MIDLGFVGVGVGLGGAGDRDGFAGTLADGDLVVGVGGIGFAEGAPAAHADRPMTTRAAGIAANNLRYNRTPGGLESLGDLAYGSRQPLPLGRTRATFEARVDYCSDKPEITPASSATRSTPRNHGA